MNMRGWIRRKGFIHSFCKREEVQIKSNCRIVIAGKGHETYQILNTGKIHFDEREVVDEILKDML